MGFDLRVITPELVGAMIRVDAWGFGQKPQTDDEWVRSDLDRTVGAFDGTELVGIGRNYSLELTMPGGTVVPSAATSWISVLPSHRRRGVLTAIMDRLVQDALAREESTMILTASEGGIYSRFGFGVATQVMSVQLDPRDIAWRSSPGGRVRALTPEAGAEIAPEIFDRVRRSHAGAVSRPPSWWESEWWDPRPGGARFDVVYDGETGPEGFALYEIRGGWTNTGSDKTLHVTDVVAATPEASLGLWRYLLSVDLITTVYVPRLPLDTDLPWLLTDARAMSVTSHCDFLWLRPVDVVALLSARCYSGEGRLVLEVIDDGPAAGRFELDAGPDGAVCRSTTAEPDLVLAADVLGIIALGGARPSTLVRAGRIHVTDHDVASAADALFVGDRDPRAFTWF